MDDIIMHNTDFSRFSYKEESYLTRAVMGDTVINIHCKKHSIFFFQMYLLIISF